MSARVSLTWINGDAGDHGRDVTVIKPSRSGRLGCQRLRMIFRSPSVHSADLSCSPSTRNTDARPIPNGRRFPRA
jgi:hypothetical protein